MLFTAKQEVRTKSGSTRPTTRRPPFQDTAIGTWPRGRSTEFGETWASAGRTLIGHSNCWEVAEMPDEIIEELWGIEDGIEWVKGLL